ncbi:N-recognin zinc finger protein (macronuclear) [Tetrahymena thermophila SB210]|uniref:E3 ubiquitin-protein ligase n=1 Tax=Tetrahymena thermophila (strain SB210) TaxID=312017 RepID=Q23Q48_TETTS|nr:N-recognin zinc finger protein [Tetrahymena thermophila SB210]EAR98736.2 N-recognin zinc finger protein [Tetrahymena thermophila SB210]|eukprot:XP_001018981.2 N-recognin zinc finger protein [Tetrahymena thermophila SB210]
MHSTASETQNFKLNSQENLFEKQFVCSCNQVFTSNLNLESLYYENLSSASYDQNYNSNQIIHKNSQISQSLVHNDSHILQNNHVSSAKAICIYHSQNFDLIAKMEKDLLLNEEYKKIFNQQTAARASRVVKPVCGLNLKEVISYHCFDCFEDRKAIICEDCFEQSDHYGHRYYSQKENAGLCDCGDQEVLHPNAKVGCSKHKGNIKNDDVDLQQLDQQFLTRARKLIPEWFKSVFESAEYFLISMDPQFSDFQNKMVTCIFKVIQSLGFKNDVFLSKAISDILIKPSNKYLLYHDCNDYENKIPCKNQSKKECTCSIIELLFRFSMSSFTYETQGLIRQSLTDFLSVQSYKIAYAKAFIKNFMYLNEIDLATPIEKYQAISNNLICLTRQEVFSSFILNQAVYETGQAKQIFLNYLKIAKFFQQKKDIGDSKSKILPYQFFYYHYVNISSLINKDLLFQKFLEQEELFDILLQAQQQLQGIIEFDHKIYMPEHNFIEKNTYLLYYRLTGQLNLFKIIANNFAVKVNEEFYQKKLITYMKKTLQFRKEYYEAKKNQDQLECKSTTYSPLERAFIYLFYAYFQFELKNVNKQNLENLQKQLGYDEEQMQQILLDILKQVMQSISLYQEVQNKMWVFNGDEFESFIKQYTFPDFELKVVDSMFVKIVTKLYSFKNFIDYIPQNPFTKSLNEQKQQELLQKYAAQENKIFENAQNMIQKSFVSFSCYLNFISYNVCSDLDEIYFKCIQHCQNSTEIGEDILSQSTTYFATLINGLSKTMNDVKSLGEIYQQDLGKKAPVQKMYQKVSKNEVNNQISILKEYENIYEPYNFTFNYDAQSRYYGAIEVNQNIQEKVVMIIGNVPIKKQDYIEIGKNTVNICLLEYLLNFLKSEYNLKVMFENIQIKERVLYSMLKLMTIFMQVQACSQENFLLLDDIFNRIKNCMSEKQFQAVIQHVLQMKDNYSKDFFQQAQTEIIAQNDQAMEVESEEKKVTDLAHEQRKKAQLLRQQEILKQMQNQQNKVKQMYFENNNSSSQSIEEECCFCKQPLSKSAYGVLVSIQNNNFYQEQELKIIKSNLKSSKENCLLNENKFEYFKNIYWDEQKKLHDTFIFNTCDHKIHKECYESNINNIQLSQYEQATREFEIKCQICKQYKNFFFEICNNNDFEEEKFENKKNKNTESSQIDIFSNPFNNVFDMGSINFDHSSTHQYDMNSYDYQGGFDNINNNCFNSDPFDLGFDLDKSKQQHGKNDEDDDGEVREIIYKKVKKNNNEAQFKESQNHSFQRINKIYSILQKEKAKLKEFNNCLKSNQARLSASAHAQGQQDEQEIIKHQKQMNELNLATEIFEKFIKLNESKQPFNPYNFGQIVQKPIDQFQFYERCLYNQIRYFDLANKRPDDDTSILKMVPLLFQCTLNSFSLITDQQIRRQIIEKRFKYCKYFEELIQTGTIAKFDENTCKDLPYILKQNYLENNLVDAYTQYLLIQFNFQFKQNQEELIKTSLSSTLKKLSLQVIYSQCYMLNAIHKYQIDNEDDIEDLSCFLLRLTRRALVTSILHQKFNQQNCTFDKVFASSSKFESEHSIIMKHFKLNNSQCLPSQNEIDNLDNDTLIQQFKTKKINAFVFSTLTISTCDSYQFDIIPIPNDYLEYSKTIYKKKCSLCNKIPLISDLMQCIICGDLICASSCTQQIGMTVGSLNRHANVCHGGQAIYINTQNGYVTVICSPHNTILISTFIFQNSLKQPLRKQIKCDWKSFQLTKSIVQNLKKQLYENNTRNLIMEDHQQRLERNIRPPQIQPNIL